VAYAHTLMDEMQYWLTVVFAV